MNAGKPLTFAAMLVRAQRRFAAVGRTLPTTRPQPTLQAWPSAGQGVKGHRVIAVADVLGVPAVGAALAGA